MADVLKFSSSGFLEIASQVRAASNNIKEAVTSLKHIHLNEENGGEIRLQMNLKVSGTGISGDTASECLTGIASGLLYEVDHANRLRSKMLQVYSKIVETERGLGSSKSITIKEISQILKYSPNADSWTPTMWDKVSEFLSLPISSALIGGGFSVANDSGSYIFDSDGRLIKSYETEQKPSGLELNITEKDPDGHTKSETKYQLGFPLKGEGKKKIKEPKKFPRKSKYTQDKNGRYHDKDGKYLPDYRDKDGVEYYDKNGKPINAKKASDKTKHKRVGTVFEASIHNEKSIALFDEEYEYENDNGVSAKVNADVLKAAGYADFKGGLYVEKVGPNGESHLSLSPGISAEVGVSGEAAHASADVRRKFGEYVSAGIGGDATVGKVEAKGSAKFGIIDGKVAAQADASLEAVAFEAEVHGDVNIAGVDVKGTAGVSVGIGAHAKVGYYNGVISCDVGLAAGLGVQGSIEVDVSELVDTVADVVDSADQVVKAVAETAESVQNYMKQQAESVGKAADEIAKGVSGFFSSWF